MYRFISYKSSAVLLKYSCSRNRYFRLPQNGSYGIENFLRNKTQKSFNTETKTTFTTICFERN